MGSGTLGTVLEVAAVRAQRVRMPDGSESWTVLGDEGPVGPIEEFLAYATFAGRSENTLRAYAYDLKLWWVYLDEVEQAWTEVGFDGLGRFVAWAQRPLPSPDGATPLRGRPARSRSTIDRALSTIYGFYEFHAGAGAVLSAQLVAGGQNRRQRAHVSARRLQRRPLRITRPERLPQTLEPEAVRALLSACTTLRDRLLLSLWWTSGMRIGQTLGLRHADFDGRRRLVHVVRRSNANRAWAKNRVESVLPVLPEVVRLHREYMFEEYLEIDSDYVFVVLAGPSRGSALSANAVEKLVARLRKRTGIYFTPHMLRHSFSTAWVADGGSLEVLADMLTHSSIESTGVYVHLSPENLRNELQARAPLL